MVTDFATAERMPPEVIQDQAARLERSRCARILDYVGCLVFVLNEQRQIVFANQQASEQLLDVPLDKTLGKRPGEALDCINAFRKDGGCGTSKWCRDCGAVKAMLGSLDRGVDVQECRITRNRGNRTEALDLLVTAKTIEIEDVLFMIVTLADISHEKRRRALERVFFHDLLNLAGGMGNLVKEFSREVEESGRNAGAILERGFRQMMDEIQSQKILAEAENNELVCFLDELDTRLILTTLADIYQRHKAARGRVLKVDSESWRGSLVSDEIVLTRVLGNLVKNALEAVPEGETVTLGCERAEADVRFWVHNPGRMPEAIQRQVFNRSFSTKGSGRGLGTYGVQLLTESCLGGRVGFTVDEAEGIRFYVSLPMRPVENG